MNATYYDEYLLRKSASRAAEIFGITQWGNDLRLIQIYSQLSVLVDGDVELIHHWIQTPNKHLDGKIPANLLLSTEGEIKVLSALNSYDC